MHVTCGSCDVGMSISDSSVNKQDDDELLSGGILSGCYSRPSPIL